MTARTHYVLIETRDPFDSAVFDGMFAQIHASGETCETCEFSSWRCLRR